jgi:hypothetical protein
MGDLNKRFHDFCRKFPGAEEIDAILLTSAQNAMKRKKADFFFENRSIICEIKSLETETQQKAEAFLIKHGIEPAALPAGEHIVEELFKSIPKGQNLYNDLKKLVTTPVESGLDSAARQIADTQRLFNLPNADGLVVILNDVVSMASPPLVLERVQLAVRKKDVTGKPYHRSINHVLHVNEKYVIETLEGDQHVTLTLTVFPATQGVQIFVDHHLAPAWAVESRQQLTGETPEVTEIIRSSKMKIDVG